MNRMKSCGQILRIVFTLSLVFSLSPIFSQPELKITGKEGTKTSIFLSDIAESVKYIPLETTSGNPIGHCRIEPVGNKLLIMENGSPLKLFDTDGSFIRTIGSIGNGPGEYPQYYSCTADVENELIYILDDIRSEVITYNLKGNYVASIELPKNTFSIWYFGGNHFLIYCLVPFDDNDLHLSFQIIDTEGRIISKISSKSTGNRGAPLAFSPPIIQTALSGNILINKLFNDSLLYISQKGEKSAYCSLDFNRRLIPEDILYDMNRLLAEKDNYISDFAAFDYADYILYSYSYKGRPFRGAYNKERGEQNVIDNWTDCGPGLINDIDGGPGYFASSCVRGNKAYTIIQAMNIVDWYESGKFQENDIKNKEAHNRLINLASNLSPEDNPVIMVTTISVVADKNN